MATCDHVNDIKCTEGYTDWSCCSTNNKCSEGRGDCDDDNECKEGLKCGLDNCGKDFPTSGYDCCYDPLTKCTAVDTDWDCCSESNKCAAWRGDCDSDSQCEEGLKCGVNNCGTDFPKTSYDCCYRGKCLTPV